MLPTSTSCRCLNSPSLVWPYAALHIKFLTLNFSFSIYRITICWILCNIFNIWSYTILPHTERSERWQSPLCKAMLNGNTYIQKNQWKIKVESGLLRAKKVSFSFLAPPYWPPSRSKKLTRTSNDGHLSMFISPNPDQILSSV